MSKIWVTVKPRANKQSITQISNTEYQVSVQAPPHAGKANQAVVELLAQYFSVPKSRIKILRGNAARKKLVQIG